MDIYLLLAMWKVQLYVIIIQVQKTTHDTYNMSNCIGIVIILVFRLKLHHE